VDVLSCSAISIWRHVLPTAFLVSVFAASASAQTEVPLDGGVPDAGTPTIDTANSDSPHASESATIEDKPAFLRTSINQIVVGDILVVLRGRDMLVRVPDLEKSGMRVEPGKREKRDEDVFISLASLAPKISFILDEENLSLTITADASLFGAATFDLRAQRPEGIIYASDPSLFVNYQLSGSDLQNRERTTLGAFTEAGLGAKGALLYGSAQYRSNPDTSYGHLLTNNTWIRLMTNLTYDWRDKLTRIAAGDITTSSDMLGGGPLMGGLGISRAFALDPYFVFLPTMQLSGTAMTPSTVEVYVNGQLVRRESLQPGQFNLKNLPLTNGTGETRVVVRDAFGGQQTMINPYYLALGTLAKGLSDFSYNAGFIRHGFGMDSWNYGKPTLLVRHRHGVTDWMTAGVRFEGDLDMVSGGTTLAFRLPKGELGAGVAASRHSGLNGAAALLSYSYIGRPLLLQFGVRYQSDHYANLSLASEVDRQWLNVTATAAATIGKVASVSLLLARTEMRDGSEGNGLTLRCNRTILRWLYAFAEFGIDYKRDLPIDNGYTTGYHTFAGLSFAAAERTTAALSRSDHWGGPKGWDGTTQATLQRSLPMGSGLGYRVAFTQGENEFNDAAIQYQGAYGRLEADYQHNGYDSDRGHASLTAAGGFVLIGGRPYLTRPVQDSFALIRVPGVGGVHGLISNQVIGTTDRKGDLLIPSLLSYYGNRIGIDDKDIPLDHEIGTTELTIAPPFRGGAIVTFPVKRILGVSGTVVVEESGETTAPAYGQISVQVGKQTRSSPLDEAGNFYLENVSPGSYIAEVEYANGVCVFKLLVQPGSTSLVHVGTVRCIVEKKEK
jgi:outer membrane usher protein